jgi:hypothetical protein
MKIQKYKVGKNILSSSNKNKYCQYYDWHDKLCYKGYRNKYGKFIGYQEDYMLWDNKGIKYRI